METLASWVPTTPEMEVKLLFGAHVWDMAQHADALGKRTHELRMPLQHSLEPCEPYRQLFANLALMQDTAERLACFYDGVLVALAARYRTYLERTDALLDAPTVRILHHITAEQARMRHEYQVLLDQLPALLLSQREPVEQFLSCEAALDDFVDHRPERTSVGAS
jgi:hypothetical protein